MNAVFADTVGLVALWCSSDQWQAQANAAYEELRRSRTPLCTTTCVLLECGNTAARTPYRKDVCELRQSLESAKMLIEPTASDWELAWLAYERGEADCAGIVDHISFQVMRRLGLRRAFTNDAHFRAAGFETLF